MRKVILSLQLILLYISSLAQSREITGRVLDASTNKPVSNAIIIKLGTTEGTYANQLGFFSLSITDNQTLIISCIGYLTSKLEVPKVNQFKVLLEKDFRELVELDLGKFEYRTLPSPGDSISRFTEASGFEKDAEYPGGWEYFYNDLGHLLKTDSIASILLDSIKHVRFTVEKDGSVNLLSSSTAFISQELKSPFAKLKRWSPALQNKIPAIQHFDLPIKWTKQLNDSSKEIFTIVEEPAHPKNGMPEFYRYLGNNITYPAVARRHGVTGRVFVEFVIEKDGRISDVRVIKGIGYDCDKEAVRVVSSSPNWIPGRQRGKPVKQRMVMPIIFQLGASYFATEKNGSTNFYEFIADNIKYPAQARRMGLEGWSIIRFYIEKHTGEIKKIEVVKDNGGDCAQSVIDALQLAPYTIISDLKSSREIFVLPVSFGLDSAIPIKSLEYKPSSDEEVLKPISVVARGIERDRKVTGSSFSLPRPVFNSFEDLLSKDPKSTKISAVAQKLKEIPKLINQFPLLTILDFENNEIALVPDELTGVTSLREVYLKANYIKELPESFSNLDSLRILGLAQNVFSEFPKVVTRLENLAALDLSNNQITEIPSEINNLKNLKFLFLQNNKITSLPKQLQDLKGLKKLYLYGNQISDEDKAGLKKTLKKTEIRFK